MTAFIHCRKYCLLLCCLILTIGSDGSLSAQQSADPVDLLEKLDATRLPTGTFYVDVAADERNRQGRKKSIGFRLYVKPGPGDGFRSLVAMKSPEEDKGKLLLLRDNKAWFLDPPSRHPTKLSARQLWQHSFASDTLTGALSLSFDVTVSGSESIQTLDAGIVTCHVLDLKSKRSGGGAAETRRYWIDANGRPWQLWYYAPSGKVIRRCRFAGFQNILGRSRPTKIQVEGTQASGVFHFRAFTQSELPDALFDVKNLPALKLTED